MTFPTAAATITRRKSFGTCGPAIVSSPILSSFISRLYASRHSHRKPDTEMHGITLLDYCQSVSLQDRTDNLLAVEPWPVKGAVASMRSAQIDLVSLA